MLFFPLDSYNFIHQPVYIRENKQTENPGQIFPIPFGISSVEHISRYWLPLSPAFSTVLKNVRRALTTGCLHWQFPLLQNPLPSICIISLSFFKFLLKCLSVKANQTIQLKYLPPYLNPNLYHFVLPYSTTLSQHGI